MKTTVLSTVKKIHLVSVQSLLTKTTASLIQTSISKAKAESTISRSDITWTYNRTANSITLVNGANTIARYTLNSNSSLTFTPDSANTLVVSKEGIIRAGGVAANVAIDIGDTRTSTTNDRRIRVNTKRAFECSGTNC